MTSRLQVRFLDCSGLSLEEATAFGDGLAKQQRDTMFLIGDLARYCEARWPDTHHQVWPEWISPGMISRAAGVTRKYPKLADRAIEATYSQYTQVAGQPDRLELLQAMIDKGQTTDESRKEQQQQRQRPTMRRRWLLAFDIHYFAHRFYFSGAGVETAVEVASWVQRTANRLAEKGVTDVACCFDSRTNHRKELTKDWEDKYKPRPPKDPELVQQLQLTKDLLEGHGFACVSVEGMESDDVMASFAAQFDGTVTIATQDKDLRQCLGASCNMLLDVEWTEDETTGDSMPDYKWLTAAMHTKATGIRPEQWTDYQAIMGDSVDGVKGAIGIGPKGAEDLIREFGTVEAAIKAAVDSDERLLSIITEKKRIALVDLEAKLDITKQLVTLHTDLPVADTATRIPGGKS